jgi:hypothetical protein
VLCCRRSAAWITAGQRAQPDCAQGCVACDWLGRHPGSGSGAALLLPALQRAGPARSLPSCTAHAHPVVLRVPLHRRSGTRSSTTACTGTRLCGAPPARLRPTWPTPSSTPAPPGGWAAARSCLHAHASETLGGGSERAFGAACALPSTRQAPAWSSARVEGISGAPQ